jgi:hypothetical protein
VVRTLVHAVAELLTSLEERNVFLNDLHTVAGTRVATNASVPTLDRKCPEPSQLDTVAASQRRSELVKDGRHNDLDVALVQMRMGFILSA